MNVNVEKFISTSTTWNFEFQVIKDHENVQSHRPSRQKGNTNEEIQLFVLIN